MNPEIQNYLFAKMSKLSKDKARFELKIRAIENEERLIKELIHILENGE